MPGGPKEEIKQAPQNCLYPTHVYIILLFLCGPNSMDTAHIITTTNPEFRGE